MRHSLRLSVIIAMLLACLSISPAYADKDHHGHGKTKHEKHKEKAHGKTKEKGHGGHGHKDKIVILQNDRTLIREYIVQDYHAHCPPGLAKKTPACIPPGQAKKLYTIGQPLPQVVVFQPVPHDLLVRLQPVPVGYQYVMVDRDVLLVSEASHHVIDAITLLSAVGK